MVREIKSAGDRFPLSTVHLALTLTLLLGAAVLAGLAAAGRVRFGPAAAPAPQGRGEDEATPGGRYRIEKLDDVRDALLRAGRLGVFGDTIQDVWAFRYRGGFVEVQVEADVAGQTLTPGPVPADWPALLKRDAAVRRNGPDALHRHGVILLLAVRPVVPVTRALASYHLHLSGFLAGGPVSPLHVLPFTALEVEQAFPYRLFVSIGSKEEKTPGTGHNLFEGYEFRLRSPLVPRDPTREEFHAGGGTDLQPNREITLLDRARGYSRIRLKARFLGDGEVTDRMGK